MILGARYCFPNPKIAHGAAAHFRSFFAHEQRPPEAPEGVEAPINILITYKCLHKPVAPPENRPRALKLELTSLPLYH
jgi:hypothetical protein